MDLGQDFATHIDGIVGGDPFVKAARLEWHQELEGADGKFVLIIETHRDISLSGGDGQSGLDHCNASDLHSAVQSYFSDPWAQTMLKRFIVR